MPLRYAMLLWVVFVGCLVCALAEKVCVAVVHVCARTYTEKKTLYIPCIQLEVMLQKVHKKHPWDISLCSLNIFLLFILRNMKCRYLLIILNARLTRGKQLQLFQTVFLLGRARNIVHKCCNDAFKVYYSEDYDFLNFVDLHLHWSSNYVCFSWWEVTSISLT